MIVRLTARDLAAVRYWATDRHKEFLAEPVAVGKRTVDVAMPYAAWLALRNTLRERAFSRSGRGRPSKLTGELAGTRHALQRIQIELNAMDVHPALRDEIIVGSSDLHIPVWVDPNIDKPAFSLVPAGKRSMLVMIPRWMPSVVTSGRTTFRPPEGLTEWVTCRPDRVEVAPPGLFLDEDAHRGWL